jgi:hypothetical protein
MFRAARGNIERIEVVPCGDGTISTCAVAQPFCCISVSSSPSNESGNEVFVVKVEPGIRYRSIAQAPRSVI